MLGLPRDTCLGLIIHHGHQHCTALTFTTSDNLCSLMVQYAYQVFSGKETSLLIEATFANHWHVDRGVLIMTTGVKAAAAKAAL